MSTAGSEQVIVLLRADTIEKVRSFAKEKGITQSKVIQSILDVYFYEKYEL